MKIKRDIHLNRLIASRHNNKGSDGHPTLS